METKMFTFFSSAAVDCILKQHILIWAFLRMVQKNDVVCQQRWSERWSVL